MSELFAGGRIIDLILVGVVIEALVVLVLRKRLGRGPAPVPFISNLLSGVFLLLAVRAALCGAAWPTLALCLLAALVAHLADLIMRWERPSQNAAGIGREPQMKATISLRVPKSKTFHPGK